MATNNERQPHREEEEEEHEYVDGNRIERCGEELPRTSGGFHLLRELGRGGMGVVYEAEELSSRRHVALKLFAPQGDANEAAYQRFEREAKLAASISHPNCVFVYGAHRIDGVPAIAMELCRGETLDDRLRAKAPVPIADALRWILDVIDGLEAAEREGIIHRDLKPSNCFMTEDGRVKVGDFGLSCTLESDVRLTRTGDFLGSPLYAAPEQVRGREVDLRSDIYSVGATLYALLTKHPPFEGAGVGEVLARILSEDPVPPRSLRSDISVELERVLLRMLAREPADRPQTYGALRAELQPLCSTVVEPGGLVGRLAAYVVDETLLTVGNLLLMFGVGQLGFEGTTLDPSSGMSFESLPLQLFPMLFMILYYGLFEGLRGATPGKWLVGQRVVAVENLRPSVRRSTMRASVFILASFLPVQALLAFVGEHPQLVLLAGPLDFAASLALFATIRRRNGYRAVHGLLSGTRVIQNPSPFWRARRSVDPPRTKTVVTSQLPSRVGAYEISACVAATPAGRILAGSDPALSRGVWLHEIAESVESADDARRASQRPGTLRWLDRLVEGEKAYEVYESPDGDSLSGVLTGPHSADREWSWPRISRLLIELAAELAARARADASECISFDQLWIDRTWGLRVLDVAVVARASAQPAPALPPVRVLGEAARRMLESEGSAPLPPDLPGHAEPPLRRLLGLDEPFNSVAEAHEELRRWTTRPQAVSRSLRLAQLGMSVALPTFVAVGMSVLAGIFSAFGGDMARSQSYLDELLDGRAAHTGELLSDQDQRARRILLAEYYTSWIGPGTAVYLPANQLALEKEILSSHPAPTEAEDAWARQHIERSEAAAGWHRNLSPETAKDVMFFSLCALVFINGLVSTLLAILARGGVSLRVFGLLVRTKRGARASRLRCAWRSLLGWAPFLPIYVVGAELYVSGHGLTGTTALVGGAPAHLGLLSYAVRHPAQSLPDRLAGTCLVPR